MRRYKDYDPFAWLYTSYWGDEFHRQIMPVLDQLLLCYLPKKARILDLCCGDGKVTHQLGRRGYQMVGLDGSEHMLAYAKQRSPKIDFLLKDARRFQLPADFDGVVSTFDSLNHVMDSRDLVDVFKNVRACLKDGGRFVFDLNEEIAYKDFWARTSTSVDAKAVSIARGSYDGLSKVAHCDVTLFRLENGKWERSDFRLSQRFHPQPVVLQALEEAGFAATTCDGQRDAGMHGDIGVGRTFYSAIARTPVSQTN